MSNKELMQDYYQSICSMHENPYSKLTFVGECVFNFTTYDDAVSEAFAGLMLEVIGSIMNRTTFDYQRKSPQHYINYLIMVNMPFLKDKLEWGGSIRGAWLDESVGEPYRITQSITVPRMELTQFFTELFE